VAKEQWTYKVGSHCTYCKSGLPARVNELMEEGHSTRAASRIMEEECQGQWKATTIRNLFIKLVGKPPSQKKCKMCGVFFRDYNQKFCSKKCYSLYQSKFPPPTAFKKGCNKPRGEKTWNWKGTEVGYCALHNWLYLRVGKPQKCECCGTKTAKKYEWANISGEYKRDIKDWWRLCTSCHRYFDGHAYKMWETRRTQVST